MDSDDDIFTDIVKPHKSFDKGLDYTESKTTLLKTFNYIINKLCPTNKDIDRLIYLTVAMIQLRNGSRIIEATKAFYQFMNDLNCDCIQVKIAKSERKIYCKKTGAWIKTKPRFRKIIFPDWIDKIVLEIFNEARPNYFTKIKDIKILTNRILKYLIDNFKWNTHSLRYACINYLIYIQKRPINDVAKFVGHVSTNMMVIYTQQHNVDKIFQLDM